MPSINFALGILLFPILSECLRPDQYCGDGVQTAVSSFIFDGTIAGDFWDNVCTNRLGVYSLGAGIKTHCSPSEVEPSWELLEEYCTENELSLPSWTDLLPNMDDDFIAALQVVEFTDIDETKIWNNSILLSPELFHQSLRTTVVFTEEYILHQRYGWAVYGFWGSILLIGMVQHFIANFNIIGHRRKLYTETGETFPSHPVPSSWLRNIGLLIQKHLTVPPAFGTHHKERLWAISVPTRLTAIVLAAYWILNLVLCCVTYKVFYPNLYYTKPLQVWRYVADRTGIMSYANLPWLWMFAGRNNIFIPLTGWSFGTFNLFHRHVACVATIQAIVHSIAYTAMEVNYHALADSWKEKYWYMGGIATITMSLLLGLSSNWFRKHTYEFFLLTHIAFAVLTVVGLFYHTAIFDGEYDGYLWPLVAIWLFDRFARLARLVYCNLHVSLSRDLLTTKAVVQYHQKANMLTMNIHVPRSALLRLAPGQHYFVYQTSVLRFWENHPFSLASWGSLEDTIPELKSSETSPAPSNEKGAIIGSLQDSSVGHSPSMTKDTSSVDTLHFIIRPYTTSGFTHRLMRKCLSSPEHSVTTRLLLEGSYGMQHPLHTYDSVIIIVGGSGITAAMPYLLEYLASSRTVNDDTDAKKKSWRANQITLVWAAREPEMLQHIVETHLHPLLGHSSVSCQFYVTSQLVAPRSPSVVVPIIPDRRNSAAEVSKELAIEGSDKAAVTAEISASLPPSGDTSSTEGSTDAFKVACTHARPDIPTIVGGLLDDRLPNSRTAVFVCGPAGMTDQTRNSVRQALKRDGSRSGEIAYFEEDFAW